MTNFELNPGKVMRLFAPLYVPLALSLWLHWQAWLSKPILLASILLLPLAATMAAALLRDRWRLELTAEALVHHTLLRTERFEWSRMGPITLAPAPLDVILQPTFWFAYPVDVPSGLAKHGRKVLGRRILCVFGDLGPLETIAEIEAWRALYQR